MGPWFIRDGTSPFRPGCSYETLRDLIKRGKVTRETILRGPTTRQFWNFAARTPSVAHLLGVCHNCHAEVSPEAYACGGCGAVFTPDTDRQHLGLAPVHLLPGEEAPEIIAAASTEPRPLNVTTRAKSMDRPPHLIEPSDLAIDPEEPAGTSGRLIGAFIVGGLLLASVVGYATWRLANMVGEDRTQSRLATPPRPAEVSVSQPAPPTKAEPEPPAQTNVPEREPETAEHPAVNADPPVASPEGPGAELLAALREPRPDFAALLRRVDEWKQTAPASARSAEAWAATIRRRQEQERLRTIP
jgi:hypothetical protein